MLRDIDMETPAHMLAHLPAHMPVRMPTHMPAHLPAFSLGEQCPGEQSMMARHL